NRVRVVNVVRALRAAAAREPLVIDRLPRDRRAHVDFIGVPLRIGGKSADAPAVVARLVERRGRALPRAARVFFAAGDTAHLDVEYVLLAGDSGDLVRLDLERAPREEVGVVAARGAVRRVDGAVLARAV